MGGGRPAHAPAGGLMAAEPRLSAFLSRRLLLSPPDPQDPGAPGPVLVCAPALAPPPGPPAAVLPVLGRDSGGAGKAASQAPAERPPRRRSSQARVRGEEDHPSRASPPHGARSPWRRPRAPQAAPHSLTPGPRGALEQLGLRNRPAPGALCCLQPDRQDVVGALRRRGAGHRDGVRGQRDGCGVSGTGRRGPAEPRKRGAF